MPSKNVSLALPLAPPCNLLFVLEADLVDERAPERAGERERTGERERAGAPERAGEHANGSNESKEEEEEEDEEEEAESGDSGSGASKLRCTDEMPLPRRSLALASNAGFNRPPLTQRCTFCVTDVCIFVLPPTLPRALPLVLPPCKVFPWSSAFSPACFWLILQAFGLLVGLALGEFPANCTSECDDAAAEAI